MKFSFHRIILMFFLSVISSLAQQPAVTDTLGALPAYRVDVDSLDHTFRRIEQQVFGVGEKLVFDIKYGMVKAGTAVISIPDTQWVAGRPTYRIRTTAKSTPFITTFYRVRDTVQTFIDTEGIFPWYFEKHLHEGGYHADRTITYDQRNHQAIYFKGRLKKGRYKTKVDTADIPPFVQGVLSSLYYVRTQPLEVGKSIEVMAYGDGKLYPMTIRVHRKEKVKVPAGKFKCIVVEPVLQSEGIFKQNGRLRVWLTDDERRLPVLMKSKVKIGSIDCRLRKFKLSPQSAKEGL